MNRFFILAMCLITALSSPAQAIFKHHKVRIGLSVTPFYSYRNLKAPDDLQGFVNEWNKIDKAKIGYSAGLNLLFAVKKRIVIETGVQFTDRGYKNELDLTFENPTNPVIETAFFKYHYNYVGIPLKLNLYLLNKKVRLFVSGGINASMLVRSFKNSRLQYNDGTTIRDRAQSSLDQTNLILSAVAGIGLDIQLIKRLSLRFEPMFSYGFYNSADTPIDYLPYEIGGTVGLHLGFK